MPMKMEQIVPKRRHIKFRRRGITQKKAYNRGKENFPSSQKSPVLPKEPNLRFPFFLSLYPLFSLFHFYSFLLTTCTFLCLLILPSHDKRSQSCEICYTETIIASWSIYALISLKLYKNFHRNRVQAKKLLEKVSKSSHPMRETAG